MPLLHLLYANIPAQLPLIAFLLPLLPYETPQSTRTSSLGLPSLWGTYPRNGSISAITAPFSRFGICRINAYLYLEPQRIRVLYLTINSDIQALTKPHIYKYSCFSLLLSSKARCRCASTASVPVIPPAEYSIRAKEHWKSR